jgi:hypothetical protein
MTSLPELPTNLNSGNIGTNVSSIVEEVIPQFPGLPKIPTVDLAGQTVVAGAIAGPVAQLQQFSAASQTTLALIEKAIPEKEINELIEKFKLPDGTVDLDRVNQELNKKYETLNSTYEKVINGLQLPPISVSGLLASLIPTVPVPNIPSPSEIQQYINNFIERKKVAQQQAIMKLQKEQAKLEETPFTARSELENNQ